MLIRPQSEHSIHCLIKHREVINYYGSAGIALSPTSIIPWGGAPGTKWVGHGTGMDAVAKRKIISCHCRESNSDRPSSP